MTDDVLQDRLRQGDTAALAELLQRYRDRLRLVIDLRLDRRLRGRIDPSDVLQEVAAEATRRAAEFAKQPGLSAFVWLRLLTVQNALLLHRQHLGVQARDARREGGRVDGLLADSDAVATQVLDSMASPAEEAIRHEQHQRLREALERMDETDREVLVLRHFEQLENAEVAALLGLRASGASMRYLRALARLRQLLSALESGA